MFVRFREMVAKAAFLPTRIGLARTSVRSSRKGPQTPVEESSGRVSGRFRPRDSTNISVQLRSLETKRYITARTVPYFVRHRLTEFSVGTAKFWRGTALSSFLHSFLLRMAPRSRKNSCDKVSDRFRELRPKQGEERNGSIKE